MLTAAGPGAALSAAPAFVNGPSRFNIGIDAARREGGGGGGGGGGGPVGHPAAAAAVEINGTMARTIPAV